MGKPFGNRKSLTRRAVLSGPLAIPFVAAKPVATMAGESDTELLALTNEYDRLEAKLCQVLRALNKAQGIAFRDYPKRPSQFAAPSVLADHEAACKRVEIRCGVSALEDEESAIGDQQSVLVNVLYVTPARTSFGALRKLQIADLYEGFRAEAQNDSNHEAAPRLVASAIDDLERMTGGAA